VKPYQSRRNLLGLLLLSLRDVVPVCLGLHDLGLLLYLANRVQLLQARLVNDTAFSTMAAAQTPRELREMDGSQGDLEHGKRTFGWSPPLL